MFAELSPIVATANAGELFRQILPFSLLGAAGVAVLLLVVAMIYRGNPTPRSKWNLWDLAIYLFTLGCIAVLGATAFVEVLRHGELGGWALFLHMVGAGAFTVALPLLALSWAHANRLLARPSLGNAPPPKFYWLPKLMFWAMVASGLIVTSTMLLSMLPVFGTDGLLTLLSIHRYSGLVLVIAAGLHFYGVAAQRVGLR